MAANFCYSEDNYSQKQLEHLEECFQNVFENEQYCVDKIENNKVYIKSENIIPTNQGILIDLNGFDKIIAPTLFSDSGGCFMENLKPMWSDIVPKERCSVCGKEKRYGVCKNKDCSSFNK